MAAQTSTVTRADLTKIHVELSRDGNLCGEWMWARALGDDIYELHNVPFFAYGLNYLDLVEAPAGGPDGKPSVVGVLEHSGHQTLRLSFEDTVPRRHRIPLLQALRGLGASFEGADWTLFALDVEPDGNYEGVVAQLDAWVNDGMLRYETCEQRAPGQFGEGPGVDGHEVN